MPFGAEIEYRPTAPNRDDLLAFDARAVPGIFFGWDLQPGMEWKGDYIVAALSAFEAQGLDAKCPVHVVKEIIVPEKLRFPLAEAVVQQWLKWVRRM